MPEILATLEAEIRKITFQSQPGQIVHKTLAHEKGVVEWLKAEALSSNPSTSPAPLKL
jgi:hypothetical protein